MPSIFDAGDRVRVDPAFLEEWQEPVFKTLAGRVGTVSVTEGGRVTVIFDQRRAHGRQTVVEFTNPDCLVKTGVVDRSPLVLPDVTGVTRRGRLTSKDHWLVEKTPEGFTGPPPMPMRMGSGSARKAVEKKIRDAARWALRLSTRHGTDRNFDPDELVQNVIIGLIGYDTLDGLGADWENPVSPPKEVR